MNCATACLQELVSHVVTCRSLENQCKSRKRLTQSIVHLRLSNVIFFAAICVKIWTASRLVEGEVGGSSGHHSNEIWREDRALMSHQSLHIQTLASDDHVILNYT
jgi:hypothetical protein